MAYDVKVNIDLAKPVGTVGFGVPLIMIENAGTAIEYTEISNISEAVTAGVAAGTDAHKAIQLIFAQQHAPKIVAVYATTGTAETALADTALTDKAWRQLIVINEGDGTATTAAKISTAVEALDGKLYFASLETDDSTTITTTGLRRTILLYCDKTTDVPVPVAALVGDTAGRAAGSFTYKNLVLSGVAPQNLTETQLNAIHSKGGISFVKKAGDNVTSEGKVAGGEYIDIIDSEDYIVQQMTYRTQKVLNNTDKVPYDNNGIALLEMAAVDVLQSAYNNGMIATNDDGTPAYSVEYALREDTKESDRADRVYLGGNFKFALAGAIHKVEITGEITV